jgi:hypothetical protein
MLKAVLRQGAIIPLDPMPAEWEEGAILEVAKTESSTIDVDAWARNMNQLCADSSVGDDKEMRQAIERHRQEAKAQIRKQMGLSE